LHQIKRLICEINKTHKGLGSLIAMNILAAKAKKTILNVAPAGTGKSVACQAAHNSLGERSKLYTSLTLAGLIRMKDEFEHYDGHIIIDDLGAEKSIWSRVSTITVIANIVYTHYVDKITQTSRIQILGFNGSASLNIQPSLLASLVQSEEWISVVRDKVIRYYHLTRPIKPKREAPTINLKWGQPLNMVSTKMRHGKLWYRLIDIGLTQWGYSRVIEHIPDLLRALAALDNRTEVNNEDCRLLIKLLKPCQLEPYLISTWSFEEGRVYDNNLYCILVELASFPNLTMGQICVDYKCSPATAERLIATVPQWCWVKTNSPKHIMPTEQTQKLLDMAGVNQKW